MKKFHKLLSVIIITLSLLIGNLSVVSYAQTNSDFINTSARTLYLSDKSTVSQKDIENYDVITLEQENIMAVNGNEVIQLVDNGLPLVISAEGALGIYEFEKLGFTEIPNIVSSGVDVLGYFVFNENNNYCYGVLGQIEAKEIPIDELDQLDYRGVFSSKETDEYSPLPIFEVPVYESLNTIDLRSIDLTDFVNEVEKYRKDIKKNSISIEKPDVVKMQLPDKNFNGVPYYGFIYINNSSSGPGSLSITQYRYNICTYTLNGSTYVITDIVSQITVASKPSTILATGTYVGYYNTRVHANITNMDVIGQSYINSNTSSSYTMSGGFSVGAGGKIVSGNASASTTNVYNMNSQKVTNDFYAQKYKNWNCDPVVNSYGTSWCVEPGIRIRNNQAQTYKSGAFTSFQGGYLYNQYVGFAIPFFEVGGWW